MRAIAIYALLAALACASCVAHTPARVSLDSAAESYVRLVLALAERDPDTLDHYRGPARWQADARARRATLRDVGRDATSLARTLELATPAGDDSVRRAFLIGQLRAVAARTALVGGTTPRFADEARDLFALERPPRPTETAAIHDELAHLLPGAGDLAARYAAFDRRFLVAPDRLPRVLARAIDACRAATRAHIDLPQGEHVDVEYVDKLAWSAFTRYEGGFRSRILVNTGLPLTVDRALDLACHEAYPGHHTIDSLLDQAFDDRRVEFLVEPLFSPQSLLQEGAASAAPELVFPDAERAAFERDVLFPLAGFDPGDAARYVRVARLVDRLHTVVGDIAWRYLDGDLEFARAAGELTRDALMASPDATLKFLNEYRSYGLVYTTGRDIVSSAIDARAGSRELSARWKAYVQIVTDPAQK